MSNDLISRANRLEKLAKIASDSQGDKQNIERIKTSLEKLTVSIRDLDDQLKTRRALDQLDVPRGAEPDLIGPLQELRTFIASRGRPSPQKLQGATGRVSQQITVLEGDSRVRWASWTQAELEHLPQHKAAALSPQGRQRVYNSIRELESLAKRIPTQALTTTFRHLLRQVHEDLGEVSLSDAVLEVLKRFSSAEGVPLTELSDADIVTLRSDPEIAAQFVVRRQVR
ncbi:hypothetical protein [Paenarthrobacter sp. NEAU-H11]|uniref:hypothetical protein n=1 Tax=Paenarthrobacter sp. NEAU-H11 TaxID=3423924 RepID=UPI003D337ECD